MYPAGILRDFLQGGVRIKVLICDDDAAYVEALVKHVVSESNEFEIMFGNASNEWAIQRCFVVGWQLERK